MRGLTCCFDASSGRDLTVSLASSHHITSRITSLKFFSPTLCWEVKPSAVQHEHRHTQYGTQGDEKATPFFVLLLSHNQVKSAPWRRYFVYFKACLVYRRFFQPRGLDGKDNLGRKGCSGKHEHFFLSLGDVSVPLIFHLCSLYRYRWSCFT